MGKCKGVCKLSGTTVLGMLQLDIANVPLSKLVTSPYDLFIGKFTMCLSNFKTMTNENSLHLGTTCA